METLNLKHVQADRHDSIISSDAIQPDLRPTTAVHFVPQEEVTRSETSRKQTQIRRRPSNYALITSMHVSHFKSQ